MYSPTWTIQLDFLYTTNRARHKNCDEASGACNNCTSTGRRCDGYDQHHLPRASKTNTPIQTKFKIVPGLAGGVHRTMNRDEQRCFSFFHLRTIPAMVGFFDFALWQQLILQMGHEEPAVYHAIVALSAFHQNSETSHDPRLRDVTLLCCLVFVLLEWLRGQYDKAFGHLHNGIQILKELGVMVTDESRARARARAPPVERDLIVAFGHLDIQSAQFGETSSLIEGDAMQAIATSQLDCTRTFGTFLLSAKEQRGADVIHLHQTTASLNLETCLLDSNDPLLDTYTPRFEHLLACVEEVTDKLPDRPSVCMDMGVIPPLFFIATGCRSYRVREQAIEALRSWPHHHESGVYD
ncbi:hypothetical protein BO82DRAFT_386876 [Aspergillus uvarum CBS 121591]|uniref:Zn(2)-C6 fungal-type domain-containing protein n=1 Tax=Aspergillus uvarum CBS 121591 TaxID=1448315 RepID=A0A319BTT4_9EURO|nr:hypothetical protein BO82DRAFT_386876 [Aspergillus uvarum CBS 121591]PYH77066.1 hypothetical protein BO82DRAFT_386876 [Aspergillus uvarum CBS 121591]